jgi:hypothetical protein
MNNTLYLNRLKALMLLAPLGLGLAGLFSCVQGCTVHVDARDPIVTNDQLRYPQKPTVRQQAPYDTVQPRPTDPYAPYDVDPYDPYGIDPYETDR